VPILSSDPYSVYALLDPFTGDVRYVGASQRPQSRLTWILPHPFTKGTSPVRRWAQTLSTAPRLEILVDGLSRSEAVRLEREYITGFREIGTDLLNVRPGGEGLRLFWV
jgi:hypothetical protein